MPLAGAQRTAAPESQHFAIEPLRRDMRGVNFGAPLFKAAPLEEVLLGRSFVPPSGHALVSHYWLPERPPSFPVLAPRLRPSLPVARVPCVPARGPSLDSRWRGN